MKKSCLKMEVIVYVFLEGGTQSELYCDCMLLDEFNIQCLRKNNSDIEPVHLKSVSGVIGCK